MTKYLYGASVQGIQSFIFQTNKLREIVGGSQLVDNINGRLFPEFYKEKAGNNLLRENIILNAAGNIKCIIEDKSVLEKIVKEFPKRISNYAPGITLSQTAVKYEEGGLNKAIEDLEQNLKIQRNKPQMPTEIGFMGLERARRTGGVGFDYEKGEVIDRPTKAKTNKDLKTTDLFEKFTNDKVNGGDVAFDLKDLTGSEKSWVAIIHADGNGLGNILQNMSRKLSSDEEILNAYRNFSEKLGKATEEAAQIAFSAVVDDEWKKEITKSPKDKIKYPMRPVVLGGDDLTIIIRADLAFEFTKEFLKRFEEKTKEHFYDIDTLKGEVNYLTACAGIAYIKDSYPFHYGVQLAEELTKEAKKISKSEKVMAGKVMPPASLAFYKVQSSFTESLGDMIKRTHFISGKNKFFASPYFLDNIEGQRTINELEELVAKLQKYANNKSKGVSKIRQWITELHKDQAKAKLMMDRIKEINTDFYNNLKLESKHNAEPSILMDAIDLHTFNYIYKK